MKTNKLFRKVAIVACALSFFTVQAHAQWNSEKLHFTVDWQMNAPLGTDFAEKISGWGMNFEAAYEVLPRWEVGVFANFHTNHKYVGRQTLALSPTESLTTDQQRSAYQLPFGVTTSYNLYEGSHVKPYVGMKLGTMFARNTTYYGDRGLYDEAWGFYVSPEVGLKIYPRADRRFGFHVAGFYNYATNHTQTLLGDIDGQSDVGFRLGILF
ncbi:outer membrane beta-barrel protein [uncultured Phocaeicola sp.]|jgi:hypothetical protein|uniref:outer membrane beta-barrel protein n=1 Tax=uncultured Phocaeicola sp. TaxID=990718 RepID=UPI0015B3EE45